MTLARPLIAREPSLGSAPAALAARSVPAPSPDVTMRVSERMLDILPGMDYSLYPVTYLPNDPSNTEKTLKVDESAGYRELAL